MLPSDKLQESLSELIDQNETLSAVQVDESIKKLEQSLIEHKEELLNMEDTYQNTLETQEIALQEYEYVAKEITGVQEDIASRVIQLRIYQQKIKNLSELQDEIARDLHILKRYVQAYSRITLKQVGQGKGDGSTLDTFLSYTKDLDMGEQQLMTMMLSHLTVAIQEIADQQQLYYAQLQVLYNVAAEFQDLNVQQYERLDVLQNQITMLQELLSNLQNDRRTIQEFIQEITQSERLLQQSILDLEKDLVKQTDILDTISQKINSMGFTERGGRTYHLSRPINTLGSILYDAPRMSEYHGITLGVEQGKEVFSPAASYVIDIYKSTDRSLSWVLLGHDDGSSTLMYPFSELYSEKGEIIPRGTILGRTGGATATQGSGWGSVFPHLTIHVFSDGTVIDPFDVFDPSVRGDIDMLPPAYHNTYIQASEQRSVYVHDVKLIVGETISQRVSSYLARHAGSHFADPQMWYNAAQGTGVEPLMGVCIAAAETSRKNFSSVNNIGNVGNNDRGDRVDYGSAGGAVRAIYKTLSNIYLGSYTQLSQFSRFGNTSGYIYASDPTNWQRNVQRCLVSLTHMYIDEDYFIRRVN